MRFILVFIFLISTESLAFNVEEKIPDATKEARAQKLFYQLNCVVCEGQALGESEASLAVDIRALVRREIQNGKSDAEILNLLASKYGQEILLKPPLNSASFILWLAPLLFLLGGGFLIFFKFRK